MGRQKQKH